MKQNIDLEGMRVFVTVADTQSLTEAAKRLQSSKSTISRRLDAYENTIGASLFRRSTRSLSLTDIGQQHYDKVKSLVYEAQSAIEEVKGMNQTPSGLIKLSGSVCGGQRILLPHVFRFMQKFPKVKVEMRLTDEIIDLVGEGIDFTLRMGELPDSELLVRRVGKGKRVVVASQKLIDEYGKPGSIQDLKRFPAILTFANQHIWRFRSGETVSVNWNFVASAIPVAVEAAIHGIGVALVPLALCEEHIQNGELIELLCDHPLPAADISLVYPRLRHQSPAAKAFLEEMRQADFVTNYDD